MTYSPEHYGGHHKCAIIQQGFIPIILQQLEPGTHVRCSLYTVCKCYK